MASNNPNDYFAIQNTISRYCIALDSKDFGLLHQVLTEDVETVYPYLGSIKGIQNVADTMQKTLAPVTTQHALTTQLIDISPDGKSASTTTYFTNIHFGHGKWEGQQTTAWGKYMDRLVLVEDGKPSFAGASGKWLIERRELEFMGRLGEDRVMEGG